MFENEEKIRGIVREELKKLLDETLQYSISKVYNEGGEVIETTWFTKIEDGHWLKVLTRNHNKEMKLYPEHFRTKQNFTKYGFDECRNVDIKLNHEIVYGTQGNIEGYQKSKSGIFFK